MTFGKSATRYVRLLFIVILAFSTKIADAQLNTSYNENDIDTIFRKWDQPGSPGCAVGVYHGGEIIFSKGYGEADLKEHRAITPKTIFYVGSVSKQFTAAAIALLSIRGKVDLDQPVRYYVPEMPAYPGHKEPTVRELVHHTSGIPDLYRLLSLYNISLKNKVPFEKMVGIITGQSHLNFEPGSEYLYSNSEYTLLAEIVKRVSGQSLREYTRDNIFGPLNMKHSHFHDNPDHKIQNQAFSYQPDGDGQFRLSYLSNFSGVGAGGLYTTVEDFVRWDQELYNNKLDRAQGFNKLLRQRGVLNNGDTLSYAFALDIGEFKGQKTVHHSGSFMGFKADYLRLPEQHYSSVIMCNLGNINPGELNKQLAAVFLKKTFNKWMHKFKGNYYSKALDLEFTIKLHDGKLYLDRERSPNGNLSYVVKKLGGIDSMVENKFSVDGWEIKFKESKQGEVKGFVLSSGRAKNIIFKKEVLQD